MPLKFNSIEPASSKLGYKVLQLGAAGSMAGNLMSGYAVGEGFNQSFQNHADLDKELEKCRNKSPQANHATRWLYIKTPWWGGLD